MDLCGVTDALLSDLRGVGFRPPVRYVYNPLEYARRPYDLYLRRFGRRRREVLLVGMNPGPWGMAQTGVPFGEVGFVRDWLGIEAPVGKPPAEHPKRPVSGFQCWRSEVSGARMWGWARDTFGTPTRFFERFFIANYCPLLFLEESSHNRTPDQLPAEQRRLLLPCCDLALRRTVEFFRPRYVIGVGVFAESCARAALADLPVTTGRILHPSPASPQANCMWAATASAQLTHLGIELPKQSAGHQRLGELHAPTERFVG